MYIQNNIKQKYKQLIIVFLGGKKTQGPIKYQKVLKKKKIPQTPVRLLGYGVLV